MDLKGAKERVDLALTIRKDKEKAPTDKMSPHDRFIFENYAKIVFCKHINNSVARNELPDMMIVKHANVFCEECGQRLIKNKGVLSPGERKMYLTATYKNLNKLVELYCKDNIDIYKDRG